MSKLNSIVKEIMRNRWPYTGWIVVNIAIIAPVLYGFFSKDGFSRMQFGLVIIPGIVLFLIWWSLGKFARSTKSQREHGADKDKLPDE